MGEHTKEPWEASGHKKSPSGWPAPSQWTIVQHQFPDPPYEGELEEEWGIYPPLGESGPVALVAGEDNAKRIVACVNACATFPTESLQSGVIKELIEALAGIRERAAQFASGDPKRPKSSATAACTWIKSECDGLLAKVKEQE